MIASRRSVWLLCNLGLDDKLYLRDGKYATIV